MAKKRIFVIVIAIFLAAVVFFISKKALTPKPIPLVAQEQKIKIRKIETSWVLVTAREIQQGEVIKQEDLQWIEWPDRILPLKIIKTKLKQNTNNLKALDNIIGKQVKFDLTKGVPINTEMIIEKKWDISLSDKIEKGKKAISIPISEVSAVSGFILPGDYVDLIIVSEKQLQIPPSHLQLPQNQTQVNVQENEVVFLPNQQQKINYGYEKKQIIMKNILILAVGDKTKRIERTEDKKNIYDNQTINLKARTATLEVSDKQASTILKAQFEGASISLLLSARGQEINQASKPFMVNYESKSTEIKIIRKGKASIEQFIRK